MDTKLILDLPKEHRQTFLALLGAICAIFVLSDLFLVPLAPSSIQSSLSGYAQAVAGAVVVLLFIYWIVTSFMPKKQITQNLYQIEPDKISDEFEELLNSAVRWRYTGNFGRYLRGKVLPTLSVRRNMHISVSIIDPKKKSLCEKHANYRNSVNSIDKGRKYDAETVALEVMVTIILCAWYVANKSVSIELYLLSMFDPLRIDSSDDAMILTVEDRRSPALKLAKDHFMYNHFNLQMSLEQIQGKKLDISGFPNCASISSIQDDDVKKFLSLMGMADLCEQMGVAQIANACREVRNPYED